jgi:subtilisin family serine protease
MTKHKPLLAALGAALAMMLAAGTRGLAADAPAPAERKPVLTADDLPRHTYAVPKPPSQMLQDPAAMAPLVSKVKADLLSDLAAYDITDRSTLQRYKSSLLSIAMLEGDYASARRLIAELRALEEKPDLKLTTGLISGALIDLRLASTPESDMGRALGARVSELVRALPWDVVQNEIKETKAGYEVRSTALIIGIVQQEIDPAAAKTGNISADIARQLVAMRNQLVNLLPYKAGVVSALEGIVASHHVVKPDRWTPTLVALPPDAKATPVLVGIWDSGVDISLFTGRVYADAAGNHGFAYDLHSNPEPFLLYPLGGAASRVPGLLNRLKGFIDLDAAIDSPESSDLKRYMGGLRPDQVKPLLEDLELTSNWAHGTHVAGIAAAGNPFARLVVGRITFDYHLVPETPTVAQAKKDAAASLAQVDYFRKNGVRVVNMSWGGSLKSVEEALEENGAGGTAEERKKLARRIFDIGRDALLDALRGAPDILFVAAAGNDDNNVKFDEFIPSSFQLPNMITVGAVDQAGEETSFSSFGPMVNVHANGFEVESYVPGGQRLKFSGTSMASPQVTNLAAKLFALDPSLTPEQAKALILAGCSRNGRVNLVNPSKTLQLLRRQLKAQSQPAL